MYSALADIWSGEIPERREMAESGGDRSLSAVDVVRPENGRFYAAVGLLPKFTGGLAVKLRAKAFSDATLSMVLDCLSA